MEELFSNQAISFMLWHTRTRTPLRVSWTDVEDTDDLRVIDRNPLRPPLSNDDQRYTAKLMARFGLDHEVMSTGEYNT